MSAGDIYEVCIGLILVFIGAYLLLMRRGHLPIRPSEEGRKQAEEWRKKNGTLAAIVGPICVILGFYRIVSVLLGRH